MAGQEDIRSLADDRFARLNAGALRGVDAVIDLTMTCGYYCQVSFLLNAFDVQLPDGATPTWA